MSHVMDKIKIYVTNLGREVEVEGGTTLLALGNMFASELGFTPVCAMVNNKVEGMRFAVYAPKQVEFLSASTPSGTRCCVRSLSMLMYCAVERLFPQARLEICNAVSHGYYARLSGVEPTAEVVEAIKAEMRRLVEEDLPILRKERPTVEVIEKFRAQGCEGKVKLLESLKQLYTVYYELEGLAETFLGCLVASTGRVGMFDLVPYEEGMLLLAPEPAKNGGDPTAVASPTPQPKLFRAFREYRKFNRIVGIRNVGDVNTLVEEDQTGMMINVAEALHAKYIREIADRVTERFEAGGAKVVLIAGPSSSGKTTFTKRLAVELLTNLIRPVMISLDNYFVDREHTPRDESGDYDYESLYSLDLTLFNQHLSSLIAGETVELPYYNFETGEREFRGERISLEDNAILLIEGIHGLNPELTREIAPEMKYHVYVSALATLTIDDHNWISTTDNRLLRRIIRDYKYRGTSALSTIKRWPSVRAGEEKWIFPYQENADSMFNSSLLFELGVMRDEAEMVLRGVPNDCREFAEAYRLRKFLSYFKPIQSKLIPPMSLLREFLGGSSFHY